jgi:hypothetical protein
LVATGKRVHVAGVYGHILSARRRPTRVKTSIDSKTYEDGS